MGCCASSNPLGDIANQSHLANEDNNNVILIERQISPDIDDQTASLIDTLITGICNTPMTFPEYINGGILWNLGVTVGKSISAGSESEPSRSEAANKLTNLIQTHLDIQFKDKKVQLNSSYIYLFSEITFRSNKEKYKQYCKRIFNDSADLLKSMSASSMHASKDIKLYLKSILSWNFKGDSKYFNELKNLSQNQLLQLSQPLLTEYSNLESNNDPILNIQCNDNMKFNKGKFELSPDFIRKHVLGISDDVFSWYGSGFFIDKKLEPLIIKQFEELGFDKNDVNEWLHDIRNTDAILEPSIVLRELFWRISSRINDTFQQLMQQCFEENRIKMDLKTDYENDIGYRGGPIKTKSRVWSKVFRDYSETHEFPSAYFMVQDWVRCALVCENSAELISLFNLISQDQYFGGKILRVKNGFHKNAKAEFGYRVLMINAIYENMIVEIQLMLLPFLKVRKKMHLHYKIVRAEKSNDLAQDFSNING